MTLHIKDSFITNHSPHAVFEVISNFSTYRRWWPRTIFFRLLEERPEKIGSKIKVRPYGGKSFTWEIASLEENKEIIVRYSNGMYSGKGVWSLEKSIAGTEISYNANVAIEDPMINKMALLLNIKKMHSSMMHRVFKKLVKYLDKISRIKKSSQ